MKTAHAVFLIQFVALILKKSTVFAENMWQEDWFTSTNSWMIPGVGDALNTSLNYEMSTDIYAEKASDKNVRVGYVFVHDTKLRGFGDRSRGGSGGCNPPKSSWAAPPNCKQGLL